MLERAIGNLKIRVDEKFVNEGKSQEDLNNTFVYDERIALYKTFYKIGRIRGDLESANASYVDMKDNHTDSLTLLYSKVNCL